MSIISKIRDNSWIIVVLVGVGMLGFILQDAFQSRSRLFGDPNTVGSINGKSITYQEFQKKETELFANQRDGNGYDQRAQTWGYLVQKALIEDEAKALGVSVSKAELDDLMAGPNMSQMVMGDVFGQQGPTPEAMQNWTATYKNPQSKEQKDAINALKEKVQLVQLSEKLNSMVSGSVYTPTWMVEAEQARNQNIDFKFVPIPYASIKDTEVSVTDADIKDYISRHTKEYTNEESKATVSYLSFPVAASAGDSSDLYKEIEKLAVDWKTTTQSDSNFVQANLGNYDGRFMKKADIVAKNIADTLFRLPIGTIVGPYTDGGNYRVAKIVARQAVADSVKARHILIQLPQTADGLKTAQAKADSLKDLIVSGKARFDSLAMKFGTDATKEKGGDLGYMAINQTVPEFNEVLFFTGTIGKVQTVKTQFGVHVIEVLDRKGSSEMVKAAYLSRAIVPSKTTDQAAYQKALEFASKNTTFAALEKAAKAANLQITKADDVKENDHQLMGLAPGQTSRDLVRWAYTAASGQVSPTVFGYDDQANNFTNQYVIAALNSISPKGVATPESVREAVTAKVRNEKKAAKIIAQIKGSDMNAIAAQFKSEVKTGAGSIGAPFIQGLGAEPKVIGAAAGLALNKVSKPIAGEQGVFIVSPTNKPAPTPVADIKMARTQLEGQAKQGMMGGLFRALREKAKINDYRSTFF